MKSFTRTRSAMAVGNAGAHPDRDAGKQDDKLEPDRPPGQPKVVQARLGTDAIQCPCMHGRPYQHEQNSMLPDNVSA